LDIDDIGCLTASVPILCHVIPIAIKIDFGILEIEYEYWYHYGFIFTK